VLKVSREFHAKASATVLSALFLLCSGLALAQSSKDYLDALRQEASGLKLDSSTRVEPEPPSSLLPQSGSQTLEKSVQEGGAIEGLAPGLDPNQFEQYLKNNYMGSYLFYRRLNEQGRAEVYGFYQENPDPEKIREKILEVSKN
jgi:hypothetical protein